MCVEIFLPLTGGLLIKSWGHTDNGVTCTDVTCAAFTTEMLNLISISKLDFRKLKEALRVILNRLEACVFPVVLCD